MTGLLTQTPWAYVADLSDGTRMRPMSLPDITGKALNT